MIIDHTAIIKGKTKLQLKVKGILIRTAACAAFFLSVTAFSQGDYVPLKTEYGQPDLQGVWNFASHTPLQRAEKYGDREYVTPEENEENRKQSIGSFEARAESHFEGVGGYNSFWYERATIGYDLRTSLITYPSNGRIPELVEGVTTQGGGVGNDIPGERPVRYAVGGISKDGPEDRGLSERCIVGFNAGPPFMPSSYNNNVQLVQHRDHVVIITEMIHDARIVPLSEGPGLDDGIRLWSGDSRGYWDGDTLVVESKNFTGMTQSLIGSPNGDSFDKFLTERFTRVNDATVEYEFTVDDPGTFTDKITAMVPMTKVDGLLYEYACHEGNYGMTNLLRGERRQEMDTKGIQ